MAILIGVDEAGYGPNLGPLVVAATAWRVAEGRDLARVAEDDQREPPVARRPAAASLGARCARPQPPFRCTTATAPDPAPDLYALLADAVTTAPADAARVAIADSKQLYKPGGGWRLLERGVGAALQCATGGTLRSGDELIEALAADPCGARAAHPWQRGSELALPRDVRAAELAAAAELLSATCADAGVELLAIRARLVYPGEYNDLVEQYGTKGAALSHVTLELVRRVVDETLCGWGRPTGAPSESMLHGSTSGGTLRWSPGAPAAGRDLDALHITCDKHGGRNRYAGLLQHHFPDSWIDVLGEGRAESRYTWRYDGAACEAVFRARGEAALPTALASMTAKYLRELSMHQFNSFWTARVAGLKPTAGYPVDARRFKEDIAAEQRRLGIEDCVIWRSR